MLVQMKKSSQKIIFLFDTISMFIIRNIEHVGNIKSVYATIFDKMIVFFEGSEFLPLFQVDSYMKTEKHGVWGRHGAMRVLDYCPNNKYFKLSEDDMKRLELIAKPKRDNEE